jgi:cytochrome c oxidase assembly factor CtaG
MQSAFVTSLKAQDGVRKVNYSESTAKTMTDFGKIVGYISIAIIVILLAVGLLFDFIPLMGWVTTILNIVAFVFTFLGYNELRKVTEDENLAAGAKLLWISAIICLATSFFGFIPFVGAIVLGIAGIADFVLSFLGWKKISNSKFNPGQLA